LFEPAPAASPVRLILRVYQGEAAGDKCQRETRALRALKAAGYPVPAVFTPSVAARALKPFMIMQHVEGELLGDELRLSSGAARHELVAMFCRLAAQLHCLDSGGLSEPGTDASVDGVLSTADRMIVELDVDAFQPVLHWLKQNRPTSQCAPCLTHGDYHPWNIIVDARGQPFVIDWTNAQLADYRFDLAWTLLLMSTSFDDAMSGCFLSGYEEVGGATVEELAFFEVYACARRLVDIYVSLRDGPERMGMRPDAAKLMVASDTSVATASRILQERTGLSITAFEGFG
jgi:aminoglycoside phosphotransferase (APT) family kinase protein